MLKFNKDYQKSIFFSDFYHLRIYEGCEDVKEIVKKSAQKANLSLDAVVAALLEIENRRVSALALTEDSAVVMWFSVNAGALAKIISEEMIQKNVSNEFQLAE